jgi:hypothetical protein
MGTITVVNHTSSTIYVAIPRIEDAGWGKFYPIIPNGKDEWTRNGDCPIFVAFGSSIGTPVQAYLGIMGETFVVK